MRTILGVDPGLYGASFVLYPDGSGVAFPTPILDLGKKQIDGYAYARWLDLLDPLPDVAVVELVGARPGQGGSSMFNFGFGTGLLVGLLQAHHISVERPTPQKWKKALHVPAEKDGARARASVLMPRHAHLWPRKKDDGIAEAALLALYGRTM